MSIAELMNNVEFIIDTHGNKKAVVLAWSIWEEIIVALKERPQPETDLGPGEVDSISTQDRRLSVRNQQALTLLQAWAAEPDDKDDAWWDEFEQELRQNRLTLREVDFD
jgi:hypothetical protein